MNTLDLTQRQFSSPGQGFWPDATPAQWNDWQWQMRHSIKSLEHLQGKIQLTDEEHAGVLLANTKLAMGITPYFFNLIDPFDVDCPIRRQMIPRIEEMTYAPNDLADPCGEDHDMPVPGLVHRYPDRVLFLVTDRCASYCRYCTRSRVVSGVGEQELELDFDRAIAYLQEHTEVRDVLLSGGDALLLSDSRLKNLLSRLRAIEHIEFLRIGSRVPIFLPQRITPELCAMLKEFHPLFISVHVNHPKELTEEVRAALGRLADAGIPLGNQSVLLRGVNDDAEVMKTLVQKLLRCRVRPLLSLPVRPHPGLVAPAHHGGEGHRDHGKPARPHHRLRHSAVRHRRPRRRRQDSDQPELRRRADARPHRVAQLQGRHLRVSRDRARPRAGIRDRRVARPDLPRPRPRTRGNHLALLAHGKARLTAAVDAGRATESVGGAIRTRRKPLFKN